MVLLAFSVIVARAMPNGNSSFQPYARPRLLSLIGGPKRLKNSVAKQQLESQKRLVSLSNQPGGCGSAHPLVVRVIAAVAPFAGRTATQFSSISD
jgi:hypothetical protein